MTKMTQAVFDALIARSGLPLNEQTRAEIYQASNYLQEMVARVTRPKPRESEPAVIFQPEQR
jgi:hypothetical protein